MRQTRESPAIIDQKSANSRISHRVIRSGFPMHRCRTNQAAIVKQKLDFARPPLIPATPAYLAASHDRVPQL
jgi:hypothetical protein